MTPVKFTAIPSNNNALVGRQWLGLSFGESSEGEAFNLVNLCDATIQADGNFEGGAKVTILGSNDGKSFHKITDNFGIPLVIRKSGIYSVGQNVLVIKPVVIDGAAGNSFDLTLNARRLS